MIASASGSPSEPIGAKRRRGAADDLDLVGRDAEAKLVDTLLGRLGAGGGALVFRGEPGIGKSALLDRARQRATALGASILSTVGVESEAELAFAGLHQLLHPIVGLMDRLSDAQRAALEAAFGVTADIEPDPFRVSVAAFQLLCDAADAGPVVLIVDDAHWLDRSSLGALAFIARRLESEPLALVAAVRAGERTLLDDARLPSLDLERLSAAAAAELLDRGAPELHPILRARVLAEAAGNPLALVELARSVPKSALVRERLAPVPTTLTARLEQAFSTRLDELPAETRAALLAAALDSRASLDEIIRCVRQVCGSHASVLTLQPAAEAGLIDIVDAEVRFRHPLIRSAVRQAAAAGHVFEMYTVLATIVADPERQLWHRAMSAEGADEELAAALEEQARTARGRGAVTAAGAALERAAALTADPHKKGARLLGAAEIAYELGLVDVVRRLLPQAQARLRSGVSTAEAGPQAHVQLTSDVSPAEAGPQAQIELTSRVSPAEAGPHAHIQLASSASAAGAGPQAPVQLTYGVSPAEAGPQAQAQLASGVSPAETGPQAHIQLTSGVNPAEAGPQAQARLGSGVSAAEAGPQAHARLTPSAAEAGPQAHVQLTSGVSAGEAGPQAQAGLTTGVGAAGAGAQARARLSSGVSDAEAGPQAHAGLTSGSRAAEAGPQAHAGVISGGSAAEAGRQAALLDLGPLEAARLAWLRQMISGTVWFEVGVTRTFVTIAEQMRDGGDQDMALRSLIPIAHRAWWTRSQSRTRQYLVDAATGMGIPAEDPRVLVVIALADPETTSASVLRRLAEVRLRDVADPVAAMYAGIAAEKAGDCRLGVRFLTRAVDGLREQIRLGLLTQSLVHLAWAATHTGEWTAAAAAASESARLARDTRQVQHGLTGELIAALVAALRGDESEMEAMLAEPVQTLVAMQSWPLLATAHLARGAAAIGHARHDEAFRHLWPVFDASDQAFHRFMRWSALLDLVEAAVGSGQADKLTDVLAELGQIATVSDVPLLQAELRYARPLLASDHDAEQLFSDALGQDSTAYPFLYARTLFSFGRWLRRQRRGADSRAPLRKSIELFDALGAAAWSKRARQELRATGERIVRRAPDARERLTAQELQIAQFAAEGLSNREIGERLFLSPRTVGGHLYRIFPKLDITGRAHLRDALTRVT